MATLAATQRLLRKDGFKHVLDADSIADKNFKIFFVSNNRNTNNQNASTPNMARLGIIASKKTLPRAVDRNAAKRKIREAFRQHAVKHQSLDMVVMVKRNYAMLSKDERKLVRVPFERVPVEHVYAFGQGQAD